MISSVQQYMQQLGKNARAACSTLLQATSAQKDTALRTAAKAIRAAKDEIIAANQQDMAAATHLDAAQRDRLLLNEARIESMAVGLESIAASPEPVGRVLANWDNQENGLHFKKVAVPLGVIGMVYESRPNVTADAAALALKSGNAIILRGGSESLNSSKAILAAMHAGLNAAALPLSAIQLVTTTDREAVAWMLNAIGIIDVLIPRGGKSLTERVRSEARVPTLLHLDGNCHIYIHTEADAEIAERVLLNAKLRRTGVCGAAESLLIDRNAAPTLAINLVTALLDKECEVRGDIEIMALDARIKPATETDWATEYLAAIISVKMVDGIEEAIDHINHYGSHHTDSIITQDMHAAQQFCARVDSAIVLVNASTQFADGGEFGFGGEIGIATGRLHARGPVAAPELTTYKYIITPLKEGGAVRAG